METNLIIAIVIGVIAIILAFVGIIVGIALPDYVYKKIIKEASSGGSSGGSSVCPACPTCPTCSACTNIFYTSQTLSFITTEIVTPVDGDLIQYTLTTRTVSDTSDISKNTTGYTQSSDVVTLNYWSIPSGSSGASGTASYIFSNQNYGASSAYYYFTIAIDSQYTVNNNVNYDTSTHKYINLPVGYSALLNIVQGNINVSVNRDTYFAEGSDGFYNTPYVAIDLTNQASGQNTSEYNINTSIDIIPDLTIIPISETKKSNNILYIKGTNKTCINQNLNFNIYSIDNNGAYCNSYCIPYGESFGSFTPSSSKYIVINDGLTNLMAVTQSIITNI